TPSRASTSRPSATCSPSPSTTTRSPSSPGAGGPATTCWPTCRPPVPTADPPPTRPNGPASRSPTASTPSTPARPRPAPRRRRAAATTALLDQLPDVAVTVRGQILPDLLRPAYLALATPAGS